MRSPIRGLAGLALGAVLLAPAPIRGQEPASATAPESPADAPHADYKVVAWFDRARPIESFQYQVYDVRKGDYTPAVDAWVALMAAKYPGYEVAVRDVDLAREKGPTEIRKVGAVVHRELLAAAAAEGVFLDGAPPRRIVARRPLTPRLVPIEGPFAPSPYLPSARMRFLQPSTPVGFPVPMPYPRPHP